MFLQSIICGKLEYYVGDVYNLISRYIYCKGKISFVNVKSYIINLCSSENVPVDIEVRTIDYFYFHCFKQIKLKIIYKNQKIFLKTLVYEIHVLYPVRFHVSKARNLKKSDQKRNLFNHYLKQFE